MWTFLSISLLCLSLVSPNDELSSIDKSAQQRTHTLTCPLGLMGPGPDLFLSEPDLLPESVDHLLEGRCSFLQPGNPTCCETKFLSDTLAMADPFTISAAQVLEDISSLCENKLSKFTCGLCRSHQDSFVQNYSTFSEVRVCLSYCQDLLEACAVDQVRLPDGSESYAQIEYENDPARFCFDLFANVENVKVTVSIDVAPPRDPSTWRSHCFSDLKECDETDYEAFYTECDHEDYSRSVFYKYKEDSKCRAGLPPPDPITYLPCYQTCPSGHYLPIGLTDCFPCPAGTQSISGYYNDIWKSWPEEMNIKIYCEYNDGSSIQPIGINPECMGWMLNDTMIGSGTLDHSQNSVLELTFYLVRDGVIGFEYQVVSERWYDGLLFMVDGEILMPLKSRVTRWTNAEFNLSAGLHVAKWIYHKDAIGEAGLDLAKINKIYIIGTKWAEAECRQCTPAHYSAEGADLCPKCPMNSYSDAYGLSECAPCDETHYAPPGSYYCSERLFCDEKDVTIRYTPCQDGARVKYYTLNEPIICNVATFSLPQNETVPCADCNPGFFRAMDVCIVCPPGAYSDRVGAEECTQCSPGSYAPKTLVYTQFETYSELPGLETYCEGDCASPGWRLLGDHIDSGVAHGYLVDVSLSLSFEISQFGWVQWSFSAVCSSWCFVELIDLGRDTKIGWYYPPDGVENSLMGLEPGNHTLQWVFSKRDTTVLDSSLDRLIIHNITIHGIETGGAISCLDCPPGYSSKSGAEYCSECPQGTYSDEGASACTLCGEGTYNNKLAASACLPCPPGTQSTTDKTDCDNNNCRYSPAPGVVYDLSPLSAQSSAEICKIVPVFDVTGQAFYINPCNRESLAGNCWNQDGDPLFTFACQYLPPPYNFTLDLGSMLGYSPLELPGLHSSIRSGLVMILTQGTPGCSNRTRPASPRTTTITFICDPRVNVGAPIAVEPIEDPACSYNFRWMTSHACPECTIDDYNIFYGPCIGGMQTKSYVPKNSPHRCYGGDYASTPKPKQVSCETPNIVCPPGQYLPTGVETEDCVDARPGHYSIGGGFVYEQFEGYDLMQPPLFETGGTWWMLGEYIRSGNGDTEFTVNTFLIQDGEIHFTYKVYAPLLRSIEPGFRFFVDGSLVWTSTNTNYLFEKFSSPLPSGAHTFQWRFTGGSIPTPNDPGDYALIDKIGILGVFYAARSDIPCRSGRFQPLAGQTSCEVCPENTKSNESSVECIPCNENQYSFPGSEHCEDRKHCEGRDFVIRYTECKDQKQNQYYEFLHPQICLLDQFPFEQNETEGNHCMSCPLGYPMNENGECRSCNHGSFYNLETQACEPSAAGYVTSLVKVYFPTSRSEQLIQGGVQKREDVIPHQESNSLPEGFSTLSTAPGASTGWRILNNTIESGHHSVSEIDSVLTLFVELLHEGSIDFYYSFSSFPLEGEEKEEEDLMLDGFQFFINGEIQHDLELPYHPNVDQWFHPSFDLKSDTNNYLFEWVYHRPTGSEKQNRIILSDIQVVGDTRGTSFETYPCKEGTYSSGGSTTCEPCDVGHYANRLGMGSCNKCTDTSFTNTPGSAECEKCGAGTNSTHDRTSCDISSCIFWNSSQMFNFSSLNQHVFIDVENLRYELSICDKVTRGDSFCFDADNNHLDTYVCLISLSSGVAKDFGRIANVYYETDEGNETMVTLHYDRGVACGNNESAFTDVKLICDTNIVDPNENITIVSRSDCETKIEWRNIAGCRVCDLESEDYLEQNSKCENGKQLKSYVRVAKCFGPTVLESTSHACPECTIDDYNIFYGPCIGGTQTKSYVPKNSPHRCYGGDYASTPKPEQVSCEPPNIVCPPGQYLPTGVETEDCVDARPGHYSIGGGFVYEQFEGYDLMQPPLFETGGTWWMLGEYIRSGNGDTEFTVNTFLIQDGEIHFTYKVYAPLLRSIEPGFRFFVDGSLVWTSTNTNYLFEKFSSPLPSGAHTFQWRFTGGSIPTPNDPGDYALIDKIGILGVFYAARSDIPCRSGRFQPLAGQTSCEVCPENTKSNESSVECIPCNENQYSFPGSEHCEDRKHCEGRDFVIRYTECKDQKQNQYYEFLHPQICLLDQFPFEQNETEGNHCMSCPLGYPMNENGECRSCNHGSFYNLETQACEPSAAGYVTSLVKVYFPTSRSEQLIQGGVQKREGVIPHQESNSLPEGFSTLSTAPGASTGWRILNNTIESGHHSVSEIDSVLTLFVELLHEGSIDFYYSFSSFPLEGEEKEEEDLMLDGFHFFINGEIQHDLELPYHPNVDQWFHPSFDLKSDTNNYLFEWVYHRPTGSEKQNRIILSDIQVVGDTRGTSFETYPCKEGTYSSGGSTTCEPCDVGHYANRLGMGSCNKCTDTSFTNTPGSAECEKCGAGTNSTHDRTSCDISSCIFWNSSQMFNFSSLNQHVFIDVENLRYELSICDKVTRGYSFCFDADRKFLDTYTCLINMDNVVAKDFGRIANVYYETDEGNETMVTLHYDRGVACGNNESAFTDVKLICDTNIVDPNENITIVSRSDCETKIEWRNIAGCRVCDLESEDYLEQNSKCENGKQLKSYVRVAKCFGPAVLESTSHGCSEILYIALPLSLGFSVLLVCVIIGVVIRNKKLAERYEILQRESGLARESGDV